MSSNTEGPPPTDSPTQPPPPPSTSVTETDPDPEPTESSETQPPPEETTSQPPPPPTTSSTSSSPPPPESTTVSSTPPPETTSEEPTTSTPESSSEPTSSTEQSSTEEETTSFESTTFRTTVTSTGEDTTETSVVTITSTRTQEQPQNDATTSAGPADPTPIDPSSGGGGGLDQGAKVAIGVVVPIAAIAILAIVGLFFWKKRKARKDAEEERRKEVEDYAYNPNNDPTYPAVGMAGGDNGYEMREDGSSGYRGWGTTLAGSTGRKASTTMSGGGMGAYSDATSPTQANATLARTDEVHSPEGEILGAMGPSANNNRGTGVNRGPSNASSSYSAAGRSDGSDGAMGIPYGAGGTYYDQQGQNPYSDNPYGGPQEMPTQPVIRDNPARRNTRIENPSHYPQQSAGISQNF